MKEESGRHACQPTGASGPIQLFFRSESTYSMSGRTGGAAVVSSRAASDAPLSENAMESWELFATLGATLAAWGSMLGLMWRMHVSVRRDIAGLRGELRGEIAAVRDEVTSARSETAALGDTLSEKIAINRRGLASLGEGLAEFRGETRGELRGINTALLVLREDFRAHVHGARAG